MATNFKGLRTIKHLVPPKRSGNDDYKSEGAKAHPHHIKRVEANASNTKTIKHSPKPGTKDKRSQEKQRGAYMQVQQRTNKVKRDTKHWP